MKKYPSAIFGILLILTTSAAIPLSKKAKDYAPGDIVAWKLPNGLDHIGIVSDQKNTQGGHPLIVHNIGAGTQLEDILFEYKIIGHYRYF